MQNNNFKQEEIIIGLKNDTLIKSNCSVGLGVKIKKIRVTNERTKINK